MKKYLPFALIIVAIIFVLGIVLVVRGRGGNEVVDEEENVAEVPVGQRPYTYLIPRDDGHWMDLTVENLQVQSAATVEYEFTYTTADGRTQGTGGSKPFKPGDDFTSEILIGTTSSGKFYYDEGVEMGELKLKFRNEAGKLIGRLATPWIFKHESETVEFEGLSYIPEDPEDIHFVAMNVFGLPSEAPGQVASGPVGIFASADDVEGIVSYSGNTLYHWDGEEWQMVEKETAISTGAFISVSQ